PDEEVRRSRTGRAGHDGYSDSSHARAHALRRSRHQRPRRAAARTHAHHNTARWRRAGGRDLGVRAQAGRGWKAGLRVGLLHGRMSADDKDATMARFQSGEIDVLVSTTVIEVGVDVANASVMVIEHAERFGLSQMHQLRGRIGRGAAKSYCVLM